MNKRHTSLHLLAVITLLAACSAPEHEVENAFNEPAISVEVMTVNASTYGNKVSASGNIQAVKSANLSTRMMGNIKKVMVKSGQKVRKGELLLTISSADLSAKRAQVEANIVSAKTAFKDAEKDLQRFTNLKSKGSASQKELENMQNRYEMMKAGWSAAESMKKEVDAQFEFLNIRAPFDGHVTNVFIKEGDIAAPGHPLLSVEDMKELEAVVMVAENDIQTVHEGQSAELLVKSTQTVLNGTVKTVSPSSKNTGGQYIVKVSIDQAAATTLPGMFVQAHIHTDSSSNERNEVFIPNTVIVENGQLRGVYSPSKEGKAILRWLRIGRQKNGQVQVLSGLKAGEKIITSADGKLFNGATIQY